MSPELERILEEAKHRYHTDAAFHARVRLAVRVEDGVTWRPLDDRTERRDQLERLASVLHALDQEAAYQASIRYIGPKP